MKKLTLFICMLILLSILAGCTQSIPTPSAPTLLPLPSGASPTPSSSGWQTIDFSYSDGIDENGLWEGVTALDHVSLCKLTKLPIPAEVHTIPDDEIQAAIDAILEQYTEAEKLTDRAVKDGDTLNIDYVGSVDGVPFEGGSTGGAGTLVTIGVTNYIDDFLEQLIGHMPGENFDIEVTFPTDYHEASLKGKDAIFNITINYIEGKDVTPELTDSFVHENFNADYELSTVEDLKEYVRGTLRTENISLHIEQHLLENCTVNSLPQSLLDYQNNSMLYYYQSFAAYMGVDLPTFVQGYMGLSSINELLSKNAEANQKAASYLLILQAAAEQANITVTEKDVEEYFGTAGDQSNIDEMTELYGEPYIKMRILDELVIEYIATNALYQ